MDLALLVYGISVLNSLGGTLLAVSFIAIIVGLFSTIGYLQKRLQVK